MDKFYTVMSADGKTVIQKHIVEFEKAEREAKKAVNLYHDDFVIMTTTHVVKNPTPDLKVEEVK